MKAWWIGCAAVASVLASPWEAQAANFLFDVNVQYRLHGEGAFTPSTFQQAWDVTHSYGKSSIHGDPPFYYYFTRYANGTAIADPSPLSSSIVDYINLDWNPSPATVSISSRSEFGSDGYTVSRTYISIQEYSRTYEPLSNGLFLERYYLRGLNTFVPSYAPVNADLPLDADGLANLFAEVGPLHWVEWAAEMIHDPSAYGGQGSFQYIRQVEYSGLATFAGRVTAVPEPSAWLYSILGFGLAGAAVRARRHQAVWRGQARRRAPSFIWQSRWRTSRAELPIGREV